MLGAGLALSESGQSLCLCCHQEGSLREMAGRRWRGRRVGRRGKRKEEGEKEEQEREEFGRVTGGKSSETPRGWLCRLCWGRGLGRAAQGRGLDKLPCCPSTRPGLLCLGPGLGKGRASLCPGPAGDHLLLRAWGGSWGLWHSSQPQGEALSTSHCAGGHPARVGRAPVLFTQHLRTPGLRAEAPEPPCCQPVRVRKG